MKENVKETLEGTVSVVYEGKDGVQQSLEGLCLLYKTVRMGCKSL